MKLVHLRFLFSVLYVCLIANCFSCTEEETSDPVPNLLIGVWRTDDEQSDSWVSLEFKEDMTGIRMDSNGDLKEFRYVFTGTTITFAGDVSGTFRYEITDDQSLLLFDGVFTRP